MSNRRKFIQQIASISAVGLINPTELIASNDSEHLCIMHTNDVHSHIETISKQPFKVSRNGGGC